MGNKTYGTKLLDNKSITRETYPDRKERKFFRKVDKVPKKTNRLIALIFREDKGAKLLLVDKRVNDFVHNGHLYFLNPEATYITDNGNRIAFYLEGISTPMSHANIEKEIENVEYTELDGTRKDVTITKIKGLVYDSKIIQIFTDRKFAEVFTKIGIDKWAFYTFIALIVVIGISVINIIVSYYFH